MQSITREQNAMTVQWPNGSSTRLPYLWLRDNCPCEECRIAQTTEKRFILSNVDASIQPQSVELVGDVLELIWPDGHRSNFEGSEIRVLGGRPGIAVKSWSTDYSPLRVDFSAFQKDDEVAAATLEEFLANGVIVLTDAPTTPGSLEQLASRLGPIREVLFDRIHNVLVDPTGYNVAHTPLPLPPHNDFASYSWPPSVQALHMLVNEASGGRSTIVDGFEILAGLQQDHPDYFEALCTMPVPFREFDENNETYTVEPMVRRNPAGDITGLRFSNQLMQTMDPEAPGIEEFYRAYHELCVRVTDEHASRRFRLEGGDILVVAAHRILHGREAYVPDGHRHLQDAYFEFDNIRNYLTVLQRRTGG